MSGKPPIRRAVLTPLRNRFDPAAACAKKIPYATWEEAEAVARIHAQRDHTYVLAHKCDWCSAWHNAKPPRFVRSPVGDPIRGVGMRMLVPNGNG